MTPVKECRTCGETKPTTDFTTTDKKRGYTYPHCKACTAAKVKSKRQANADDYNTYQREYYARPENKPKRLQQARIGNNRHYHKMKYDIFKTLGGACARCGFNDHGVLQIHHRHGGGGAERLALGYMKTLRNLWHLCQDDPSTAQGDFSLVCANCHHRLSTRRSPQ